MGLLRDLKMERTRQQIVDVAVDFFLTKGFEETTMEEIAERAEVGSTTLYRYFPSKDLIIIEPFRSIFHVGDALRERPEDESLSESLGALMIGDAASDPEETAKYQALRRIIDDNPGPRARFWDLFFQGRDHLASALAERMGDDPTAPNVLVTAIIVLSMLGIALDRWWAGDHSVSRASIAELVMDEVDRTHFVLPSRPTAQ